MSKIFFPTNVHPMDRAARVSLGALVLVLTLITGHVLWSLAGVLLLVTGVVGSCPLYTVLGLRTCRPS